MMDGISMSTTHTLTGPHCSDVVGLHTRIFGIQSVTLCLVKDTVKMNCDSLGLVQQQTYNRYAIMSVLLHIQEGGPSALKVPLGRLLFNATQSLAVTVC